MSWQKRSIKLIFGLPLSLPIVAYAVNIGDTYVKSQQNEPLDASINVSDIDPATFSVKLANTEIYQQLGLSKETDINVRFVPSSSDGGQIILSTSQPVNTPFTDVVLDVANKGETKTLPKTLLLPIDEKSKVLTQSNTSLVKTEATKTIVGESNPVELPVVKEAIPVTTNEPVVADIADPVTMTNPSNDNDTQSYKNLVISETRHYGPLSDMVANNDTPTITPIPQPTEPTQTPQPAKQSSKQPNKQGNTPTNTPSSSDESVTYVVQRNDNLWTIASELAHRNKKDVNTVMKEIMSANPHAFVDNDPTKLIANTELNVPRYQVMPSQIGVKSANNLKKQYKATQAKTIKQQVKRPTTSAKSNTSAKPTIAKKITPKPTAPKVVHKTEMKIIAPSQNNGATQGSNKSTSTLTKGVSSQIVSQVQQKRQFTAQQASKVGQLNQSLVNAEKRLKLQNSKLAQLEQRLKELNKQ
ncbi:MULTISPECIES: FimV family protein [unclassified Moraxella]|uniref:type IV pilus assembly protein FimV n=1 Tax=unclassified Moraxella TaxID=2685852 RepID=UPI003AF6AEA6